MTPQLRSELLKPRTTRSHLVLRGWMIGLIALVVALHVLSFSAHALSQRDNQMRILGLGTTIAVLFAAPLGAMSITGEFRTGTIRPPLLVTARRPRIIAAEVAAGMLAGAGDYAQLLAGGACAAALFAATGVGIGAAVRNQVAALLGLCVWLLLVEPLLLGDHPSIARYAPEASAGAIAMLVLHLTGVVGPQ